MDKSEWYKQIRLTPYIKSVCDLYLMQGNISFIEDHAEIMSHKTGKSKLFTKYEGSPNTNLKFDYDIPDEWKFIFNVSSYFKPEESIYNCDILVFRK